MKNKLTEKEFLLKFTRVFMEVIFMKSISIKSISIFSSAVSKILFGVFVIFLFAQVQVPISPVPLTLYPVGVMIISLFYSQREALSSMISFMLMGSAGVPLFAGFYSGPGVMIGPDGGYISGMLLCVYVVTTLRKMFGEDSLSKLMLYSIAGLFCIFLLGLIQLSFYVGMSDALKLGLYPFILKDIVSVLLVSSSSNYLSRS